MRGAFLSPQIEKNTNRMLSKKTACPSRVYAAYEGEECCLVQKLYHT
jgi:hypothetical protein